MSKEKPKFSEFISEIQNRRLTMSESEFKKSITLKELDTFNEFLNKSPNPKWIKENNGMFYLPIDKVEWMLTYFFQNWRREILRESVMFNAISATVRLHVQHPITGEWTFHDGGGAVNVQVAKDKSASDLSAIKHNAVQLAYPSAISYALSNAAGQFGKVFGRDLGRKGTLEFSGAHTKEEAQEPTITQRLQTAQQTPQYEVNFVAQSPEESILNNL